MVIQILHNSLIDGLVLSLVALGFHIIFSVTKIFHVAHGGIYVAAVYFYFLSSPIVGVVTGIIFSLVFAFLLGMFIEWSVYKPLSIKSSNENITLISSLGVYIIIINIISILFGNDTKILDNTSRESLRFGEVIITKHQLWQIFSAISIIIIFSVFIKATGYGLKMKAISDNPLLARVTGINIQAVRYISFGIGSVLTAAAALLKGFDTGIDPYSGMEITLSAAVVVIIGGASYLFGTIISSMLLAITQNFSEYYLTTQWKSTITFVILIIVLLWRTEGILQFNIRFDEK